LGLPVIGVVPVDDAVVKSRDSRKPIILLKPKSSPAKALLQIARKVCGVPENKSILKRLLG
ncbi:MAG: hypothetical protein QSU88_02450, partial [Candidatus Methanoperedens sp.]|nr:hypothetical protein [Candidatus Methanoperedens sp.]